MPAALFASMLFLSGLPLHAQAQNAPSTAPAAPAAPEAAEADARFTQEELRKLLAPYALYPDDLLAQLLPSCAYPIEIVQSARWLDKNKEAVAKGDFSGLDTQGWQPSVLALTRFPQVIAKLNEDLDATTDLGDAFVNQPEDVAAIIQQLRSEAQKSGALTSTPQQRVTVEAQGGNDYIVIEPTEPGVIYVPSYDPAVVYESGTSALASGVIGFGLGVAVGAVVDNAWDWGRGWVYPPRWPGYPGYRPGGPGNINIGNDINIGNGNGNIRPWRPDPDRYRPGQGSKPGLAKPGNRPGSRPGAGSRPDIGGIDRPAIGNRPGGGPAGGDRPAIAGGPGRPEAGRPGGPNRPAAGRADAAARPAARPARPTPAQRPSAASRPSPRAPARPNAFADVRAGGGAHGYSQRGSVSRQSVARPPARGGGGRHGGGGGRGGGGRR
ncbi:hypothetical protein J2X65_000215 [Ancylobacter sp. 3268]|nr:hypothetical protein [Ancylobacter sp. 3268]